MFQYLGHLLEMLELFIKQRRKVETKWLKQIDGKN
jgi:hypothetical protein